MIQWKFSPVSYRLKMPEIYSRVHPVFHVSKLKEWRSGDQLVPFRPLPEDIEGSEEFEVEQIKASRVRKVRGRNVVEYLIK